MNQILSQDEVDALLRGLDNGEVETEKDSVETETEYQVFDWSTQGRNLKGNIPILGVINGRFARNLRHSLSASLRKMVDVDAGPIEMIKFEEFQRSLPIPTSLHLFKMTPLRGMGMLVLASRLVFNLVEAYFGGSGTGSTKVEGRDFTPIEKRIIEKVVGMALGNLREAWEDVYAIETEFVRSESNPLGVNVVPPSEFLISVKLEVELNKSAGSIILCFPYSSIQPVRERLAGSYHREEGDTDRLWVGNLQERLKEAEIEMSVELGTTHLSIKDYLGMKKGDILVLENDIQETLVAKVAGVPKLVGYAGRCRDHKMFKVEDFHPDAAKA